MPWLASLGFTEDELEFEKSFLLNLPNSTFMVNTEEQIKKTQPRLDILVKRDGENLFVIEAKRDSKKLTDKDKWQAIAYARMVRQMAPIAIVTNGVDYHIYKVGDGSEIDKNKTAILGYKIEADLETIYQEAFECFIGLSSENVKIFCDAQINEGMKTLLGSREKRDRKFIPELYVPSKNLLTNFDNFLRSDKPVFALIGESGSGKTCAMCGLARDLTKGYPVLFYRALDLTDGLMKPIANDFNWEFSAHLDEITLFKRLNRLLKGKKVIIFIDGIDEWTLPTKVEVLGGFASKISNRNFKLVISCKSGQWDKFIRKLGTPTALAEEVYSSDKQYKGCIVQPFDDEEFFELIKKYKSFYGFKGLFESDVLDECKRSPFLLRVFFEVAYKTKAEHLTFSIKEFYDEYYKAVIEKIPDESEKTDSTLKAVARIIFEKNRDSIELSALRNELKLNISEIIMPSLFENNLLEKTSDGLEMQIGFYFQKLRDYIIAFRVKKWDKVSVDEFKKDWERIDLSNVQLDSISFFYQFADIEKKRIIDEPLRTKAEAYLNIYIRILDEHFFNFRHRFDPYTNGQIGFLAYFDPIDKEKKAYGFRKIQEGDERIKLLPFGVRFWSKDTNLPDLMGATNMSYRYSRNKIDDYDSKKEVLECEIVRKLTEIVDKGQLNETNNYYLSLEKVLGIIVYKLNKFLNIRDKDKLSQYLPINLEKVEQALIYKKALQYYERQFLDNKIEQGVIKPVRSGSNTSYSYSWQPGDWEFINKRAQEAVLAGTDIPTNDIDLKKLEEALVDALSVIKKRKQIIDETILPDTDAMLGYVGYFKDNFKKETIISFIHKLYRIFLDEYKILVETNFPTLKSYFALYSQMPLQYFIIVSQADKDDTIKIFKCKNGCSSENTVTLCNKEDTYFDRNKFSLTYQKNTYNIISYSHLGVDSLLPSYKKFIGINIPSEFTILRSLVYREIKDELPKVLEQLGKEIDINKEENGTNTFSL